MIVPSRALSSSPQHNHSCTPTPQFLACTAHDRESFSESPDTSIRSTYLLNSRPHRLSPSRPIPPLHIRRAKSGASPLPFPPHSWPGPMRTSQCRNDLKCE